MKLKELTDLKVAKFVGVTNRTLQNWKRPPKNNAFLPFGKHNLYKGARLATYLLMYKEGEEETEEIYNNLENMLLSADKIEKLVELISINCKSKYLEDLKKEASFLKEKLEGLQKLTDLI